MCNCGLCIHQVLDKIKKFVAFYFDLPFFALDFCCLILRTLELLFCTVVWKVSDLGVLFKNVRPCFYWGPLGSEYLQYLTQNLLVLNLFLLKYFVD